MNLSNEFNPIRKWCTDKGIIPGGNAKTQTVKLGEEFGELCSAVNKMDSDKAKDAIGDCVVVLTSIAYHMGTTIEEAINTAYYEIKNRKGKMVDGDFQKDQSPYDELTDQGGSLQ